MHRLLQLLKCTNRSYFQFTDTYLIRLEIPFHTSEILVQSLNENIVTDGDTVGHPSYNLLTRHDNES